MSATISGAAGSSTVSVLALILCCDVRVVSAAANVCYSEGGIVGIVFATMFATLVTCVIALLAYYYVWKPRRKGRFTIFFIF